MNKHRIGSIIIILAGIGLSFFISNSLKDGARFPFKFGLDLVGGTELIYRADISNIEPADIKPSMETLRDVIERRINIFGVSEPLIQIEEAGIISGNTDHRLIVELPGVKDMNEAIRLIGLTPLLEFRLERDGVRDFVGEEGITASTTIDDLFEETGLTGSLLRRATLQFDPTTGEPLVSLEFNEDGNILFREITTENTGKVLAILLDGQLIQTPVIREPITDGRAQISGSFTPEEAREVVGQLNYGALPLPIELVSTQTIGATLGEVALSSALRAGIIGFILLSIFMIFWYRLPGLVSVLALLIYGIFSLTLFLLIPVTLTAAGLAGFILSIGMAVDANVLIFERMKEELLKGSDVIKATEDGFARAWLSIRDSNISSLITAVVLFWLGTSAVKGFALTFGVGVLVSMFSAITASRTFLYSIRPKSQGSIFRFLFGTGLSKSKPVITNN
jgi:protein-export membrane protein SecD